MSSIWTIRRSTTDAKVSGLCGGVAQHWGVDPVLVRVGCVMLALSGGVGIVLYLAGWLLIPAEGKDRSTVDDLFGETVSRWPRELWLTLVVIACIAAFVVFGFLTPFSIAPAVVIAIIWYFGFYKPRQSKRADTATAPLPPAVGPVRAAPFTYPGPPTPFTQAAEAWARRIEENARAGAPAQWSPIPAATTWPSPPPPGSRSAVTEPSTESLQSTLDDRGAFLATADPVGLYAEPVPAASTMVAAADRRSARRLRLVALIVLGLVLCGLGVLDSYGVAVPLAAYLAASLLVLGVTLVAATWLGRAWGLLPLGLLLAVAVAAVTVAGPTGVQMPAFADQSKTYADVAALPVSGDSVDVGNLTVDLSRLALSRDVAYSAHTDVGNLTVVVPADTRVVVRYSADAGAVTTFGNEVRGGSDVKGETADPAKAAAGQPTLTLDVSVDVGHVEVRR